MEQQASTLVAARLLTHVRRAVLLLGGVFVWWLVFLAGGAAHADDSGTAGLTGQVVQPLSGHVARAVETGAGVVSGTLRATPSRVAHDADAATGDAPAPVVPTLSSLTSTLEAGLSTTTNAVADVVDKTTARTTSVLPSALRPTGTHSWSRVSPSRQLHSSQQSIVLRAASETMPVTASGPLPATSSDDRSTGPASDDDGSLQTSGGPVSPGLPGGSSSGGPGSAASLAGLVMVLPGVRRIRRARGRGRLAGGPAYPPGSSPD